MTYYEIENLRVRALGLDSDDSSQDTVLTPFGTQADSLIDDELFIVANRNRRLTQLPALPLAAADITQSLKDAATDLAVALFLKKERQMEAADSYEKQAMKAVKAFVLNLDSESGVYGVILE